MRTDHLVTGQELRLRHQAAAARQAARNGEITMSSNPPLTQRTQSLNLPGTLAAVGQIWIIESLAERMLPAAGADLGAG